MKLGVLTVPLYNKTLEEAVKWLSERKVTALEIGCGGYPGNTHLNSDDYLGNDQKITECDTCRDRHRSRSQCGSSCIG